MNNDLDLRTTLRYAYSAKNEKLERKFQKIITFIIHPNKKKGKIFSSFVKLFRHELLLIMRKNSLTNNFTMTQVIFSRELFFKSFIFHKKKMNFLTNFIFQIDKGLRSTLCLNGGKATEGKD